MLDTVGSESSMQVGISGPRSVREFASTEGRWQVAWEHATGCP